MPVPLIVRYQEIWPRPAAPDAAFRALGVSTPPRNLKYSVNLPPFSRVKMLLLFAFGMMEDQLFGLKNCHHSGFLGTMAVPVPSAAASAALRSPTITAAVRPLPPAMKVVISVPM